MQLGGIALDVPRLSDDVNGDPLTLVLDRRRKIGCYRAEDLLDIAASGFEELLPRIEAREPQEILDQPLHSRRMSRDDLEELVRVFRIGRTIEQRLDISANGCEWCPQLVGDIGDEIAPDLIGAAQVGDVVQHEHGATARACHWCRACEQRPARIARERQFLSAYFFTVQRRCQLRGDVGMTDHFEVRTPRG